MSFFVLLILEISYAICQNYLNKRRLSRAFFVQWIALTASSQSFCLCYSAVCTRTGHGFSWSVLSSNAYNLVLKSKFMQKKAEILYAPILLTSENRLRLAPQLVEG